MPRRFPYPIALVGLVAGCIMHNSVTPDAAKSGTDIVRDQAHGLVYVRGPTLGESGMGGSQSRQLVTALDTHGEITDSWIDYLESAQGPHTSYSAATDETGHPLKVEKLDRERGTRETYPSEEVAVYLPTGYVREHLHDPIAVRLDGRRGYTDLTFGSTYVQGYWSKLLMAQACVKDGSC